MICPRRIFHSQERLDRSVPRPMPPRGVPLIGGLKEIWPQICYMVLHGRSELGVHHLAFGRDQSQTRERPGKSRPLEEVTWPRKLKTLFLLNGDCSSRS